MNSSRVQTQFEPPFTIIAGHSKPRGNHVQSLKENIDRHQDEEIPLLKESTANDVMKVSSPITLTSDQEVSSIILSSTYRHEDCHSQEEEHCATPSSRQVSTQKSQKASRRRHQGDSNHPSFSVSKTKRGRLKRKHYHHQSVDRIGSDDQQSSREFSTRICIYVSGCLFETDCSTLLRIPDTRLYHLAQTYEQEQMNSTAMKVAYYSCKSPYSQDKLARGYHFDRHPGAFEMILNYYRTGKLHCPLNMCGPMFEEELMYWGINDSQMEACCWNNYRMYRNAQKTLAGIVDKDTSLESDMDEEQETCKSPDSVHNNSFSYDSYISESEQCSCLPSTMSTRRFGKILHEAFDRRGMKRPISMTLAIISMIMRIFAVVTMAMGTMPLARIAKVATNMTGEMTVREFLSSSYPHWAVNICEVIAIGYFVMEIVVRLGFSNNRRRFMRMPLNWVDFIALCTSSLAFGMDYFHNGEWNYLLIELLQFPRILRLFRLTRFLSGLKILLCTARASIRELLLLAVIFSTFVIFFGTLAFLLEQTLDYEENQFRNLPYSWWWALVTITTLGYGDIVPKTVFGYLVGILCAMCGILVIALPVPIVVNNFALFYSHEVARRSMPKDRRKHAFKRISSVPVTSLTRLTRALSVFKSPFPTVGRNSINDSANMSGI